MPTEAQPHGHSAADFGACFVKCARTRRGLAPSPAPSPHRWLTRYEAVVSAARAQLALDGRDFDGHAVSASFLPDDSM